MAEEVVEQRDSEEELPIEFEKLDALGMTLALKRSSAISGRKSSGIEEIWAEDEEF